MEGKRRHAWEGVGRLVVEPTRDGGVRKRWRNRRSDGEGKGSGAGGRRCFGAKVIANVEVEQMMMRSPHRRKGQRMGKHRIGQFAPS